MGRRPRLGGRPRQVRRRLPGDGVPRAQRQDCGANADPTHTYRKRIDAFVKQLIRTYDSPQGYRYWQKAPPPWAHWRASWRIGAIVLEPDAIGLMGARSKHCIRGAEKTQVLGLLRYAVDKLTTVPGLAVYIDGGAADWLHVDEAVKLLRSAGVAKTRGFTLNASHFDRTTPEIAFGNKVAKQLGKHYVLNTAENANGTLAKKHWHGLPARIATNCNPKNAGLGRQPTSNTGSPYADAFLWISRPGLSSNAGNRCRRGPTRNTWFQGQALLLARQANFHAPSWPPRASTRKRRRARGPYLRVRAPLARGGGPRPRLADAGALRRRERRRMDPLRRARRDVAHRASRLRTGRGP